MTATHANQLVDGYLGRLELELRDMPPGRRQEILDEIRDHISEERRSLHDESDADLLNLLDRLGDPSEIAAAARDGRSKPPATAANRVGAVEILALILTPTIWPAGVVLLWASSAWTTRQKLLGTLVPPGGYPGLFIAFNLMLWISFSHMYVCSTSYNGQGNVISSSCPPDWVSTVASVLALILTVALLALPVVVGIYLATRLRRPRPGD
jgi:hypothetical protein